jgi:hypothetical protein
MLSQIYLAKTQDVGKISIVHVNSVFNYPLLVNLLRRAGGGFREPPRILAWAKKRLLITKGVKKAAALAAAFENHY